MIIKSEEELKDWIMAGKLTAKIRDYAKKLIQEDASYLKVTELIEQKIKELNAKPAFPPQLSINEIAAHQCADPDEDYIFKDGDIVKIDVGVMVNGAIGDSAYTVVVGGGHDNLLKASREALSKAISIIKPGIRISEIGRVIEATIKSYGFQPIKNLSGHGLGKYSIHEPPSIPNYDNNSNTILKENQVIAIEPFATNGIGIVQETGQANIFAQISNKPVRSPYAREILREISKFNGLPFTTRWLTRSMSIFKVKMGLRELLNNGIITQYPPLREKAKGLVSQYEHSLLVKDTPIVLTESKN